MKYLINDTVVSVVIDGKPYNIPQSSGYYDRAVAAIKANNESQILEIVDAIKGLKTYLAQDQINDNEGNNRIEIRGNSIYFCGNLIHNVVCDRIIIFMKKGLPFNPLYIFLTKLMDNPSQRSVDNLYTFIERHNLVIEEDGDIIAWKAVTNDLKDKYSQTINNMPGQIVEIPRNQVADDPTHACSQGLHAGNYSYVLEYGSGADDRFVMVKINPRDVVCIPFCSDAQKMRICRYEVLEEVSRESVTPFDNSIKISKIASEKKAKVNKFDSIEDKIFDIVANAFVEATNNSCDKKDLHFRTVTGRIDGLTRGAITRFYKILRREFNNPDIVYGLKVNKDGTTIREIVKILKYDYLPYWS